MFSLTKIETLEVLQERVDRAYARYSKLKSEATGILREHSSERKKRGIMRSLWKGIKFITGVKAFQDRGSAKELSSITKRMYGVAREITNLRREILSQRLQCLGKSKKKQLKETIGLFLGYLSDIGQKNIAKEYEFLNEIGVELERIKKRMGAVDMPAATAAQSAVMVGALGAAAASVTPELVTGAVASWASASTGTAIASLHGVTATNATLAWLGGGSIAAGGGGVAAGTATLATITTAATGAVAILAAGCLASAHYSNKLTKAVEDNKNCSIAAGNMEIAWVKMEGIEQRALEMQEVMDQLAERIHASLVYLAPLIPDFDKRDEYHIKTFQSTGILVAAMGKLVEAPILENDAELSSESVKIIKSTQGILNKEFVNYGK